jgi:GTPase SAR1 family protein
MSLLGLYGPFAVGKTTFIQRHMDDFADSAYGDLTVVLGDLKQEYWLNNDHWILREDKPKWKGTREDKTPWIDHMIGDKSRLWIVESARYFGGLQDVFIQSYERHSGGLRFVVPITEPDAMKQFLIERCEKRNKEFRKEYWDDKRLAYESQGRYINAMEKHYIPIGVKCHVKTVTYDRREWVKIARVIREICCLSPKAWYDTN